MENILNAKKNLLENYNDQLSSNNTQLIILRDKIELKKKALVKEQCDSTFEQDRMRFDHSFLIEERRAQFFKLLNLQQSGLKIFSNMIKFESIVDTLIKVILDIAAKNLNNFNMLDYDDVKTLQVNETQEQNFHNIRKSLFSIENMINQNLIDQIATKMVEFNYVQKDFIDKCILFESVYNLKQNQYAIYHYLDVFLVLELNSNSVDNAKNKCQNLIQNLLYEEYLSFLCEHIYSIHTGLDVKSSDITALSNCFEDLNKLDLKADEEEKIFLKKITDCAKKKNKNAFDQIVCSNLSFLYEYYDGLEDHTEEQIEIKSSISLWKKILYKRMAYILNEETEKRKHLALSKIESTNQSDTMLNKEFDLYNQKIEQLESSLSEKMKALSDIDYKIAEKQEQYGILKNSYSEQTDELDAEIFRMQESLKIKEKDLKAIEKSGASQEASLEKLRTNIEQVKARKLQLEKKANALKEKINELKQNENTLLKDKAQYVSEISCCKSEKKLIQDQQNQLEKQIKETIAWKNFIQIVYGRLLDDKHAFQKRASLINQLNDFKNLTECYKILVKELNIEQVDATIEHIAGQNEPKRRIEIQSCLLKLLAEPNITLGKDSLNNQNLISIDALNIHFEHVLTSLKMFLSKEIDEFDLYFDSDNFDILATRSKNMSYDVFFKQNLDTSLKRLIDKKLRIIYLFEQIYETDDFFLEPQCLLHNQNDKFKPFILGSMKMYKIFNSIRIDYKEFFAHIVKSVKILAGNNIFVTEKSIELKGSNLAMIAAQNIVLTEALKIDTSGQNGQEFKNDQALSFSSIKHEAEPLTCGKNGVNGFDGVSGQNGGHIYLRAENQIINLDKIELLNSRGGNGAVGQKGGNGQKGGKGQDIGDAKAEDFSMCVKNPAFSAAFAREPGFSLETGDFTLTSEISGNGGDAGQAGFGGQEGLFGQITLIDCDDNLSTNADLNSAESKFVSSASLMPFLDSLISNNKILVENGEQGTNAEINGVYGGDAGEPGTYGSDNVIYDSCLFRKKVNLKGDFSNYLGNGGSESIFEKPDSYALNSVVYKLTKIIGIGGSGIGGIFQFGVGFWLLVPFCGYLILETVSGLKVQQRQFTAVKNKNHKGEIQFKNRYCDKKPIKQDSDMTERRRTDKSKGKKGEKSQLKKETSRQEHSKASACKNLFTDNAENALDMKKIMQLEQDHFKEQTIESLEKRIKKDKENSEKLSETFNQIEKNMQKLNLKKESVQNKLEQNQIEQNNFRSQFEQANRSIDGCESEEQGLQNKYLNETSSYLDLVRQKSAKQIQFDLSVSELKSKYDVKSAVSSSFTQIKSHIELTSEQLSNERAVVIMNLEKVENEKKSIANKLNDLLVQELDNVKFQSDQTKEINKLNEIQNNVLNEQNEEKKSQLSQETMLTKEFKTESKSSQKTKPELIQISQCSISNQKYQSLFGFFARISFLKKAPSLKDLIKHIEQTHSSINSNDMLGKLEFVIEVLPFLKENEQFPELIKIFNTIVENNSKFTILYEQIALNYWSLEDFVDFETIQANGDDDEEDGEKIESLSKYSLEVFYTQRDSLSPLEQLISNFIAKKTAAFYSIENLYSTKQLLRDYFDLIEKIASLEYTGLKVLKKSANNFYRLFIQTFFAIMEKEDFDYKELEQILIIFSILNDNIRQINSFELWSKKNLFKHQLNMLDFFAPNIEFCLSNLKYISSSLEDSSLSNSKKELLGNYLFAKLVHVLNKKMKREDFEKIKQKINETKIENLTDKSILIEQFESTSSSSKYSGLSLANFVLRYKCRLDLKQNATLSYVTQNVIQYCLDSKDLNEIIDILKELIFLINFEYLSHDETMVILKKLTKTIDGQKASIELFLVRLAKILSTKAESELVNKVNSFEFNRIFYECVKNRIKNSTGSFINQTSSLVAFYEQVNRLLTNFQNETKSEEENEFEKNVTSILNYTNEIIAIQNVSNSEIKLLKSICSKIDENMNCFEMVEFILFDLAIIQSSLFSLTSKDKKDKEKQFNYIKEKVENFEKSNNLLIKSIKQHVQSIDENLSKNNRIETMMKNLDNVDMFVSYLFKLVTLKKYQDSYLLEIMDSSLKYKFQNDCDKQVNFILDCVQHSSNQKKLKDLFIDLAKQLEIDQLFHRDKIDCIFSLYDILNKELDKNSEISQHIDKFERKTKSAFVQICDNLSKKCQIIRAKQINENVEQTVELINQMSSNLSKNLIIDMLQLGDLFRMIVKIKEFLNQFNYEINILSSEVELTKSEKKMNNDVIETMDNCLKSQSITNENNYLIRLIPHSQAKFDIYLCFLNLKLIYETELNLKELEDYVLIKIHAYESQEIVEFFTKIYYIVEDNCLEKIFNLKENLIENLENKKVQLIKTQDLICQKCMSKVNQNQRLTLSNRIHFLNSLLNRSLIVECQLSIQDKIVFMENLGKKIESMKTYNDIESYLIDLINFNNFKNLSNLFDQKMNNLFKDNYEICACLDDLFDILFTNSNNIFSQIIQSTKIEQQAEYLQLSICLLNSFYFRYLNQQETIESFRIELLNSLDQQTVKNISLIEQLNQIMIKTCFKLNDYQNYEQQDQCDNYLNLLTEKICLTFEKIEKFFKDINSVVFNDPNFYVSKVSFLMHIERDVKNMAANFHTLKTNDAIETVDELVNKIEKLVSDTFKKTSLMELKTRAEQIISSNESKQIIDELKIGTLYLLDETVFYFQTSLAHTCLTLKLEEVSQANEINQACYEQLKNGINYLVQLKDLRLSFYSFHYLITYLETSFDQNVIQIVDYWFIDLMFKVFSLSSPDKKKYIETLIEQLNNTNITKYFTQLDFILPLLSSNVLDKDKIKNTLVKLANNPCEFSADICFILLKFYHTKYANYQSERHNLFMRRILNSFKDVKKLKMINFYIECDHHLKKHNSINSLFSIESYLCDILSPYELELLKHMQPSSVINEILDKHCDFIWSDVMESMFISIMSNKILNDEKNVILEEIQHLEDDKISIESNLRQLVDCSNFNFNGSFNFLKSKIKNHQALNSIRNLKKILIISNEIIIDKHVWIEFIDGLTRKNLHSDEITKLLSLCRYFYPKEKHFIELVKNCEPKYLISYVLLESVKNLFSTILSHSSTNFQSDLALMCECVESNFLEGDSDNDYYLEWLASILLNEINKKTKLQISEIEEIKNTLQNGFCLGINQTGGHVILNRLEKIPILKWNNLIRIELVKKELNRPNCDKLAKDIVYLEDLRGICLVNELVLVLKSVALDQFTLSTLVEKFKKNEWHLNFKIVQLMKEIEPKDWIRKISEYDQNEKKKEMCVQELIDLMRQKESPNEANYSIRDLICANRETNHQCLLEQALDQIQIKQNFKSTITVTDIAKSFVEYDESDVKNWTNAYKQLSKVNVDSILSTEVIELCCVLSRGSKLIFGYELRSTQLIALILFIDAMLKRTGRLANISTGEGKSVITIVTTIAHLLIRGGTVDILTSSELLAERDAIESEHFFNLFNLKVSNNCDLEASQNESVRQNRYQNNQIIYGVIGNFQRDLLLTKYYGKPIRKELATCLIVDEVDSMCIDNMCNTLYISHQIADLKYLKDVYVYIWQAVNMFDTAHYTVKNVEKIKSFIELKIKESQIVYPASLQEMIDRKIKLWIENAYLAKTSIQEGDQYSIISKGRQTGQAVINDLRTGIEQLNTQWSDGLQQFIQLKHFNKLNEESLKSIFMSNYIFFKQYNHSIFGMTGTLGASEERDLLSNAYALDFFHLPRFKKDINVRHDDFLLATRSAWLTQIKQSVNSYLANNRIIDENEIDESKNMLKSKLKDHEHSSRHIEILKIKLNEAKLKIIDETELSVREKEEKCRLIETQLLYHTKQREEDELSIENIRDVLGEDRSRNSGARAVLIICKNKKDVNDVVRNLLVNHKHLYDFYGKLDGLRKVEGLSKRVATHIRQLRPGDIVVATNVAGRGTDFRLSNLLLKNGGLHVILSYVPDNERVELQAFGRSGRKGQPGSGNLIVYDKRLFSNHELTVDLLKQERDAHEEERLMEIRIKMIPRVVIEKKLFEKFEILQEKVNQYMVIKENDSWLNQLQIKSLHNKWALWLEKMSSLINNVYRSNEKEKELFNCFDNFADQTVKDCYRDQNGIQCLIDEPSELIKLAKFNILNENYDQAIKNCDAIIGNNCIEMCAFAYLYKAIALFRPVKNIGFEIIDKNAQNFKGGFKIISYRVKQDGIYLLKVSIELLEKEMQRIQMRSQVLCNIGKENIKSGIGSKGDHFSKSNANEITVLQMHLNAAQSALKTSIDCDKLSSCLNSTKLFNRLDDIDEKKANDIKKSLFEAIVNDCQSNNLIKKERLSKKCTLKCHINFKNREKIVREIIGEELIRKALKTSECFVLNQFDSCLEKKLKLNSVDFSKEIYINDFIDSSGYKHVKLPSQFFYLKEKLIKQIENANDKTTNEREKIVINLSKECISLNQIFDIISEKFCLQSVKCIFLHQESDQCLNNETIWSNDVFGQWANLIKTILSSIFENSNQCVEYSNLIKLIRKKTKQKNLLINVDRIVNYLLDNNFLTCEERFKFADEKHASINEYKSSLHFSHDINSSNIRPSVERVDFSDFIRLQENKEEIIQFFVNKLENEQKIINREEFEEKIFDQNSDEYSYGFLKILLTLKKIFKSLNEYLDIDLTTSNLDENEITEVNNIVLELADLKYFTKQNISLAPLDSLIEYFQNEKLIKGKCFKFKYRLSHGKLAEEFKNKIKTYAQNHVTKLIDEHIDNGQYLTESDLKELKSKLMDKFVKEKLFRYEEKDILKNIKMKTRKSDIRHMASLIESSLMNTIGALRLNEKCYITCNLLSNILKETNLPREANEFIQDDKDLFISFNKYNSPWTWRAAFIMSFGCAQICAGCLLIAYPILGPISFHISSGLISEGCGDIMFALNNAGNISKSSYLKHKLLNMLITCVCVGIGGYLSRASSVTMASSKTIQEQAIRLSVPFATKESSFMASRAIAKKALLEIGKCVIGYFKGVATNILSSLTSDFLKQMLRQFSEKIISLIRQDQSYNNSIKNLQNNLEKLCHIVKKKSYRQSSMQILDEKLKESIQQHSDTLNNRIENMLGQVAGPLSSQIEESAKVLQYSGLTVNYQKEIINSKAKYLIFIAKLINKVMKIIKAVNIAFDIICTARSIAKLANDKISIKINNIINNFNRNNSYEAHTHTDYTQQLEISESQQTVLNETRPVSTARKLIKKKEEEQDEHEEMRNDIENKENNEIQQPAELDKKELLEIEKQIESVNQSILDTIYKKIELNIVKPAFSSLINFSLASLYKKLEDHLGKDLEYLKKRSLAFSEYQTRNKNNPIEPGTEMDIIKDFLIKELKNLSFDSPILEIDLDDIPCGKVNIIVDGKMRELDLSNQNDRQFIRDHIGAKGIRFFTTQNGIILSRPNFINYIRSITPEKKFTQFELTLLANQYNMNIKVITGNEEEKTIETNNGDESKPELCVSLIDEHYEPMVKNTDGKYELVSDLASPDNQCGPYAFFYAMKMNQLINEKQISFDDADKQTRNHIGLEVDNMIRTMQEYALSSESAWKLFVSRDLEGTSIVGGNKRNENSLSPGKPYYVGSNVIIEQIDKKTIKPDIKEVKKIFDEFIDKAKEHEKDYERKTRKCIQHKKQQPTFSKTKEGMKTQMMIGFVIVKTKNGKKEKLIFASGNEPLYSKQLTDDNKKIMEKEELRKIENKSALTQYEKREELKSFKTKKGFKYINTGLKEENLKSCAAKKAYEYIKTEIGLENIQSIQLAETLYEYKNDGNRNQPNMNGKSFAKSCKNCISYFEEENEKAKQIKIKLNRKKKFSNK